jgi:glycosyltransferase involved in cell wall biosynthesis
MPHVPRVSVLLPVRDAAPWLTAALDSLWRQTFPDFEVIAVDDGSRDGSHAILARAALREPRLRVTRTDARGLPAALNTALALARAPLVARHDADDLSHRDRLARQYEFMAHHADVAVVGSRVRLFPGHAIGMGMRRWASWHNSLLEHDAMAREALIDSPLCHGTALARRAWLERVAGWAERGWAEDLDLWIRLLESGARFAKLPYALYGWRQHAGSATRCDPRYSRSSFIALKREALLRGLLRSSSGATLVGVGRSVTEWHATLSQTGLILNAIQTGTPSMRLLRGLHPPLILVFGAAPARERWRRALISQGFKETAEFAFVA